MFQKQRRKFEKLCRKVVWLPWQHIYGSKAGSVLQLGGQALPRVTEKRHLGVSLARNLRWGQHIDCLIKKVSASVALCKSLAYRHHLPAVVIKQFYVSYIRSKLEYCSAVWCGASQHSLRRLERIQLQLARAISRIFSGSSSAILSAAGLPTLAWRRREHCLLVLWKVRNGQGPPQLEALLPAAASSRSTVSLRSSHSLEFPPSSTSRHLSSFFCKTIPIWNALPSHVVSCGSAASFCRSVRKHFNDDKYTHGLV